MLSRSFSHLPSIGTKTERRLWAAGCRYHDDFLGGASGGLPPSRWERLAPLVRESRDHCQAGDLEWFHRHLPTRDHWRLFAACRDRAAYLDIETTGTGAPDDAITP